MLLKPEVVNQLTHAMILKRLVRRVGLWRMAIATCVLASLVCGVLAIVR
jgi:hypothetical protein